MKKNKGFGIVAILIIVVAVLIAGGIMYYAGKTSKTTPPAIVENNLPQENQGNITLETYESSKAGYEVEYPSNWTVASESEGINFGDFEIKNSPDAILPGGNSEMRNMDSYIAVQTSYGILDNGINFKNYSTIDEMIKDPEFGLSTAGVKRDLASAVNMDIGGKNLRVEKSGDSTDEDYSFIYNGKVYTLDYTAGSLAQFNTDHKVFSDLLSSFKFTDSLPNDTTCNDSPNYFLISRTDPSGNAGNDILVKYKTDANQKIPCDYSVAKGDFEIKNESAQYFYAIVNNLLIVDEGTGTERDFLIYDLGKRAQVFEDSYSASDSGSFLLDKTKNTLTYLHETDTKATPENCPDFNKINALGGGVVLRTQILLDLNNFTKKELGETICGYSE